MAYCGGLLEGQIEDTEAEKVDRTSIYNKENIYPK